MLRSWLRLAVVLAASFLLPLLGALLGGIPAGRLVAIPLQHPLWDSLAPRPWPTAVAWLVVVAVALLLLVLARPRRSGAGAWQARRHGRLPRYAWLGVLALLAAIAAVDAEAVNLAGGLLLLAVTLVAGADTERRSGSSLIRLRPGYFFSLFAVSLAGGWTFYWLNLFLQLWSYPPADELAPFVLGKSVDYATLLPALLVLRQWLGTFPRILSWTSRSRPLPLRGAPQGGLLLVAISVLALLGASLWPDWVYPLTLLAPLGMAVGLTLLARRPTPFAGVANGDWSRVLLPGAAALLVGLITQGANQTLGPAWVLELPLIGGPELLGLPIPAWLWLPCLGLLGVWLADQLAGAWKQRSQRPPDRPRFPVKIVLEQRRMR
jgi:hypothetical protein